MRLFVNLVATMLLLRTQSFHLNHATRGFAKALRMKKDFGDSRSMFPVYKPKSENQRRYVKYLCDSKIRLIFAIGPAGTGKTLFACNQAISDLKQGLIEKIIITRPVVPVEEDIGFLPGNINKKMDPWTRPIFDIFLEFYSQRDIDMMLQNGVIEISPLAYMRGRTFKKAFIIADEMQNSSPNQMMMLTTRLGIGSKMVVTGDLKQSDKGSYSGLLDFIKKFNIYEKLFNKKQEIEVVYNETYKESNHQMGIKLVELETSDVERSPIVSRILEIYDEEKTNNELTFIIKKEELEKEEIEKEELKKKNEFLLALNETNANNQTFYKSPKPGYLQTDIRNNNDAALIPLEHKRIIDKYWWDLP
jgi:phosphate starvation-inducible PhoH-like protein